MIGLMPAAAQAQPSTGPLDINVWVDSETGERVASTIGNGEVKNRQGYSPAALSSVVMWVEARQAGTVAPRVFLVGQQLRYTLPSETQVRGKFGRSDPKDPAYVDSPFSKVDVKTRWTEIICVSDAYYCSRIDEHEIALSPDQVRAFTAGGGDIPVALTRKNRIDWRVPKSELIAALNAIAAANVD